MTLRAVKPETMQKRLKLFTFSEPGVGKTTGAIQFPQAYIIDMEKGTENYSATIAKSGSVVYQTTNPNDVRAEVKELLTQKHPYRTLIIDPITIYYGALQEKWNMIFAKAAGSSGKSSETIEMQDWGFRYWAKIKSEYKSLMRMILALDMNVIITAHQKDTYGAGMQRIGVGPDSMKGDSHVFDYVFQLSNPSGKIDGKRLARTIKERAEIGAPKFPDEFEWSYANFCKYYGKEVLERESKPMALATKEQLDEIQHLLETVKIDEATINTWLTKADVDEWSEMTFDTLQKCIDFLKKKIEPTKEKASV